MKCNREQALASRPDRGVTLVIAGAGTGKTSCLIEKTRNLIEHGIVPPGEILILTFSRKAADEISERIVRHLGPAGKNIAAGTFHSFSYGIIREYLHSRPPALPPLPVPSILDREGQESVIDELIRRDLGKLRGLPAPVIRQLMGKERPLEATVIRRLQELGIAEVIESIRMDYERWKTENNVFDFGDLIVKASEILTNDASYRKAIRERHRYLLVDEFQDTSEDNFRLLKLILPEKNPDLFVVGDDWQSIYGFRNARVEYIIGMKKFFDRPKIIKLKVNYRSRREIVALSGRFIARNRRRTAKKLVSASGPGGAITAIRTRDRHEELACIKFILSNEGEDIAVLYRNNWQGELIKKRLGQDNTGKKGCEDFGGGPRFMTMHASKGLEFRSVIIAGISDDIIPDPMSDLEEERRLFYVALTRAREKLYLLCHGRENGKLPRFLRELGVRVRTFSGLKN